MIGGIRETPQETNGVEVVVLAKALRWFLKYPEFVPAQARYDEMLADVRAARPIADAILNKEAGLCEDEGCPHSGTSHICVSAPTLSEIPSLRQAAQNALAFYDGLPRVHDEGEARVLDELQAALKASAECLHGPFGYLVMALGLDEEHWRLSNEPENDAEHVSLPMFTKVDPFASSGQNLADAHSKNPPEEKSPITEATGLSEIADQQQPEAEHG